MIITNYNDAVMKWTGSGDLAALTQDTTTFKALCGCSFENYAIFGNLEESGTANPRRVRWSAVGNGESYPADNYLDLRKTSDFIVSCRLLRDRLVVYKEESITLVDYIGGDDIFDVNENYVNGVGPLNDQVVVQYGWEHEAHYFLGWDLNIYMFDGMDYKPLSRGIDKTLRNINPTYKVNACGVAIRNDRKIIWAVPSGSNESNDTLIIYDALDGSWWIKEDEPVAITALGTALLNEEYTYDTLPYDTFDEWDDPDGYDSRKFLANNPEVLFGCSDGYVRKWLDGADDDGETLTGYYRTPWDTLDDKEETIKVVHRLILEVENAGAGSVTLAVYKDLDDTNPVVLDEDGNMSASISLDADDPSKNYFITSVNLAVQGSHFSFKFLGSAAWSVKISRRPSRRSKGSCSPCGSWRAEETKNWQRQSITWTQGSRPLSHDGRTDRCGEVRQA
ncbi:MAG: hypothetical protein JRJ78_17090 [Deltaproteobacteria bacterium]|nr:hypothetical protein [Deltaproteobacteria bacterium]